MVTIRERGEAGAQAQAQAQATLTLTYEQRRKSRLRARLDDGREVALLLPRGGALRDGDLLRAEDGLVVRVVAGPEEVSTASSSDLRLLARACYHLGNRHIAVEVGEGWARYLHDHVLDDMVAQLGLHVRVEKAPFEPEVGAYGHGGHGHSHAHDHDHHHDHGHDH